MKFVSSIVSLISIHVFVVGCERICENEKRIKVTYARFISLQEEEVPPKLYDAKLCSMDASNSFNFLEILKNDFGAVTLPEDFKGFIESMTAPLPIEELREKFIDLFKLPDDMILIQMHDPLVRDVSETTPYTYWHVDFHGMSQLEIGTEVCRFDMEDVSNDDWEVLHVFNMWIPLKAPFSMPLGFMDMETVSESQFRADMFASLDPPPEGTMNSIYYLPNMQVGQAYLFDTRKQSHGAFDDRIFNGGRNSIDQRFAILKAKSDWALKVANEGRQQFKFIIGGTPYSIWVDKITGKPIYGDPLKQKPIEQEIKVGDLLI